MKVNKGMNRKQLKALLHRAKIASAGSGRKTQSSESLVRRHAREVILQCKALLKKQP